MPQSLRPDARVHVLPAEVAVRSPEGSLIRFATPDPAGLAQAIRDGAAPDDVAAEMRRRGLLGGADTVRGTQPALLPPRPGPVVVQGDGEAAAAARTVVAALGHAPAAGHALDPATDILLVALDRWDVAALEACNVRAQEMRQPWLACGPVEARRIQVGPLVVPGETACHACYLSRRVANAASPAAMAAQLESLRAGDVPQLLPSPWAAMAGQLGAWEAVRYQSGVAPASLATAVSVSADTLETSHDPVPRAPRCAVCSRLNAFPANEPWMPLPRGAPSASP